MKSKNRLQNCLRGWFPRDPALPLNRKIEAAQINPKTTHASTRAIGGLAVSVLVSGLLLLVLPYLLFPDLYTLKAKPEWGYTTPNSWEGWVFIAAGLGLVFVSVALFVWFAAKLKSQGSKWTTYMWFTPRYAGASEKKIYLATVGANIALAAVFLYTIAFTTVPTVWAVAAFPVLFAVVNLCFFEFYRRKTSR